MSVKLHIKARANAFLASVTRETATRWALSGLSLARELSGILPGKGDTKLQTAVKLISTVDSVRSAIWPVTGDPVAIYANRQGLTKQQSEPFVKLFFTTDLSKKFSIGHVRIGDWRSLIEANGPLGRFVFVKADYDEVPDSTFYVGSNVNMPIVLEGLWKHYNGRIHVTVTPQRWGCAKSEFATFDNTDTPLFGCAAPKLDSLVERHMRCKAQGVARSYMFFGPPGTGKSLFTMRFASNLGKRVMKLAAPSLEHATIKDLLYLFENLMPDSLIVDDVDKVNTGNALPTLLEILQRLKATQTTVLMTANTIQGFDSGLLRPERIDTWLEFKLPELDERTEVIKRYVEYLGVNMDDTHVATIAEASDMLSHDYLRELIVEYRQCGSFDETMTLLATMKRMLQLVKPDKKEDKPVEPKNTALTECPK